MKAKVFLLLLGALLAGPLQADDKHHKGSTASAATQDAGMNDGEVRKVDKDARKLTIKHGPLAKLDMPPMTMVFQVKDTAMLDQVKAGDRIKFDAEKVGGAYIVTRIEAAR
jgi:Cu(I)/Ag(I) efflux system protein CusF